MKYVSASSSKGFGGEEGEWNHLFKEGKSRKQKREQGTGKTSRVESTVH